MQRNLVFRSVEIDFLSLRQKIQIGRSLFLSQYVEKKLQLKTHLRDCPM